MINPNRNFEKSDVIDPYGIRVRPCTSAETMAAEVKSREVRLVTETNYITMYNNEDRLYMNKVEIPVTMYKELRDDKTSPTPQQEFYGIDPCHDKALTLKELHYSSPFLT